MFLPPAGALLVSLTSPPSYHVVRLSVSDVLQLARVRLVSPRCLEPCLSVELLHLANNQTITNCQPIVTVYLAKHFHETYIVSQVEIKLNTFLTFFFWDKIYIFLKFIVLSQKHNF